MGIFSLFRKKPTTNKQPTNKQTEQTSKQLKKASMTETAELRAARKAAQIRNAKLERFIGIKAGNMKMTWFREEIIHGFKIVFTGEAKGLSDQETKGIACEQGFDEWLVNSIQLTIKKALNYKQERPYTMNEILNCFSNELNKSKYYKKIDLNAMRQGIIQSFNEKR